MKIKILDITHEPTELIELAARECYGSQPNPETRGTFIRGLIKSGHESPIEHAKMTVRVSDVSRSFTHQLVRHRLMSFSQASQRYMKFGDDIDNFIVPQSVLDNPDAARIYGITLAQILEGYKNLCDLGLKKEDARMLLPNAAETSIVATANFREWRHFFDVRAERHAQWEIRQFALSLLHWLATRDDTADIFADQAEKYFADVPSDYNLVLPEVR